MTTSTKALKIIDPTTNRPIMYHRPPSASSRRSSRSGISGVRSVSPASSMSPGDPTHGNNAGYPGMFSIPVMNGVGSVTHGADTGATADMASGKSGMTAAAAGGVSSNTPKASMYQQQQQHQVMHQPAANAVPTMNTGASMPGSTVYPGYPNPLATLSGGMPMVQPGTAATFASGVIPTNPVMSYTMPVHSVVNVNGVAHGAAPTAAAAPTTAVPQATYLQPQFMRRLDTRGVVAAGTAANNAMSGTPNASTAALAQQVSSVMPSANFNQYQQHAFSAMTPGVMAYPQAAMVSGSPYVTTGLAARTLPPMPPGMSAAASSTAVMLTPAGSAAMHPASFHANNGLSMVGVHGVVAPASHDSSSSAATQQFAQALSNPQMQPMQAGQFVASRQPLVQSQQVNSSPGAQPIFSESGVTQPGLNLHSNQQPQQQHYRHQQQRQPVSTSYVSRQFASAATLPSFVVAGNQFPIVSTANAHTPANLQSAQQHMSIPSVYSGSNINSTASGYTNQIPPGQTSAREAIEYVQLQQALAHYTVRDHLASMPVTSPNTITSGQETFYDAKGAVSASASYLHATQQQATGHSMSSMEQMNGAMRSAQSAVTSQQPLAASTVPKQSVPAGAGAVPLSKLDGEVQAASAAASRSDTTTKPNLESTDDYLGYWRKEIQEYIKLLEQNSQVNLILRMRFIVDRLNAWFKEAAHANMHSKDAELVCRRSMRALGYDWDSRELYKKTYKHDFVQSLRNIDSAFGDLLTGKSQLTASNPAAVSHQQTSSRPIPDKALTNPTADGSSTGNSLKDGEKHLSRNNKPLSEEPHKEPQDQPSGSKGKTTCQPTPAPEHLPKKPKGDQPSDTASMSSSSRRLASESLPQTDWGSDERALGGNHEASRERRAGSSRFSQQPSSRRDPKQDSYTNRRSTDSRGVPSGDNRSHSTSMAGDRDKRRENGRERSSSKASSTSNHNSIGRSGQRFPTDRFPLPRGRRPSQSSQSSDRTSNYSQRSVSNYREREGGDSRDRRASVSHVPSGGSLSRRGGRGRTEPQWHHTPRFSSKPVKVTPLQSAANRHSSLTLSATSTDIYRQPRPRPSSPPSSESRSGSRHQLRQPRQHDNRPPRDHQRPHDFNRPAAAQAGSSESKASSSTGQGSSLGGGRGDGPPNETHRGGHRGRGSRGSGRGRRGRGGSGTGRGHYRRGSSGPGRGGANDRRSATGESTSSRSNNNVGTDSRWQRKA